MEVCSPITWRLRWSKPVTATSQGRAGWNHSEIGICWCSLFPQGSSCPGSMTAASSAVEEMLHLPPSWSAQRNESGAMLPKTTHSLEFPLPENTNRKNPIHSQNQSPFKNKKPFVVKEAMSSNHGQALAVIPDSNPAITGIQTQIISSPLDFISLPAPTAVSPAWTKGF